MPFPIEEKLVVAVASSALFDLADSDAAYRTAIAEGDLGKYAAYQREREDERLEPGAAFPFVRRLLSLNDDLPGDPVEVVLLSRNSPDTGLRVMKSIRSWGLPITRAAFLGGEAPWCYMESFNAVLFLSANERDVTDATNAGLPAGRVLKTSFSDDGEDRELRIAFDFDGVLADDASEAVFQDNDLEVFKQVEAGLKDLAHLPGPLKALCAQVAKLQEEERKLSAKDPTYLPRIKTALITSRDAPADERAIKSLRAWGVKIDQAFFLGGMDKSRILAQFKPHIFFDDQIGHLTDQVPSVHIPFGLLNEKEGSADSEG